MLRGCPYCQRIHDSKYDCGMEPKEVKKFSKPNELRNSTAWIKKKDCLKTSKVLPRGWVMCGAEKVRFLAVKN